MTLAFYMDVNIPFAITAGLRRRGIDALTSQEDGTRSQLDEFLLQRATDLARVMISPHDSDVLKIARRWQDAGHRFDGCIFVYQQGLSIGRCIGDLELIACCCLPDELVNHVVFVPFD
jgi:hypothetical protein